MADIEVRWLPPEDGSEELFAGALRDSGIIQDALKLHSKPLKWPEKLTLLMGGDGLPRYASETHRIHIPFDYLALAVRGQYSFETSRAVALQRGLDVIEYTLYHLLGHALLDSHDTNLDEVAESLATWLMVNQHANGGEQWLEDVLAFGRASQKLDGPLEDYWQAHGLSKRDAQRLNCLVIGSNPSYYLEHLPALAKNLEQAMDCENQWIELEALVDSDYKQPSSTPNPEVVPAL